jgi:hypothetical protein
VAIADLLDRESRDENSGPRVGGKGGNMCNRYWFLAILLGVAPQALADAISLGSFTFNWSGTAPVGTSITLKVGFVNGNGTPLLQPYTSDVSGLNKDQAANNFLTLLTRDQNVPVQAQLNGTNSINVFSVKQQNDNFPVTKIRETTTKDKFSATMDGNVNLAFLAPMPSWQISFDPASVATTSGNLVLTLPTVGPLTTSLSSGSTADDATMALFDLLRGDGFPDVQCLDSAGIPKIGCSDSTSLSFFFTPFDSPISTITEFSFDGAGLDSGLALPTTVPEPASVYLVSFVVVIFVLKSARNSVLRRQGEIHRL